MSTSTFDDKLFEVVKQVQEHENDISGIETKPDNIVQVPVGHSQTGKYVVMHHMSSGNDINRRLVKLLTFNTENISYVFRVIITSRGSMGTSCGFFDVVCKKNDTSGTKRISIQYNEKLYKGNGGIYVYSQDRIQDVIVSGFIPNIDDIQFVDDTPENLSLEEITFE